MPKFVINPGHGGSDPGAQGNGIKEKDLNLMVALKLGSLLQARGIEVYYTRTTDKPLTLEQRSNYIVQVKPDAALDLHHNAYNGQARGIETYRSAFNAKSKKLAEKVHPELIKGLGMADRGIKTKLYPNRSDWDYYHMIREPQRKAGIPVIITEAGFIDNTQDAAIMKRAGFSDLEAEALARGICAYLGVAWDKAKAPATPASNSTLYRVQVGAYAVKANAEAALKKVQAAGFKDAFITVTGESAAAVAPAPTPAPKPEPSLKVGSKVRVKKGAKDYNGTQLASFVYTRTYDVIQISGDRVVIGQGGTVTAAVCKKDLILV